MDKNFLNLGHPSCATFVTLQTHHTPLFLSCPLSLSFSLSVPSHPPLHHNTPPSIIIRPCLMFHCRIRLCHLGLYQPAFSQPFIFLSICHFLFVFAISFSSFFFFPFLPLNTPLLPTYTLEKHFLRLSFSSTKPFFLFPWVSQVSLLLYYNRHAFLHTIIHTNHTHTLPIISFLICARLLL